MAAFAAEILETGSYKGIAKTKYVNDRQITDHYAIIPTGQGFGSLNGLKPLARKVYEVICRRFLSIFYPPAVFRRVAVVVRIGEEKFFAGFKVLADEGWYKVAGRKKSADRVKNDRGNGKREDPEQGNDNDEEGKAGSENAEEQEIGADSLKAVEKLKKGDKLDVSNLVIRTGETSPPKRYNSGSMILAMENAGQLIEDEELRAQIKGSGIGTSATRAEILSKLVRIAYLQLNKKTQIITPTLQGEVVFEIVNSSIRQLLNPELTASWEKGLTMVADGEITESDYMKKLDDFVTRRTDSVKQIRDTSGLRPAFERAGKFYK